MRPRPACVRSFEGQQIAAPLPTSGCRSARGKPAPRACAVSLDGLGRAAIRPGVLAVIWLAVGLHSFAVGARLRGGARRPDFSHYYASALAAREGLNPYTLDLKRFGASLGLDVGRTTRATGTPTFILCFEPLTLLSPAAAYRAWLGANLFFLAATLALLVGGQSGLDRRSGSAVAALALLYPPLEVHFQYAQTQVVVLLLLVLALRALARGCDAQAGLTLALAGLLRGFPLIVAGGLVAGRRWRALGYTAGGLVAGGVATALAMGPARAAGFVDAVGLIISAQFVAVPANVALGSFVSRIFWYAWAAGGGDTFFALRFPAAMLAGIALLALTVRATMRPWRSADYVGRAFALWVCATILLAPTAWLHYLVLLLIPFVLIAGAGARGEAAPRATWAAVASYAAIALAMVVVPTLPTETPAWMRFALEELTSASMLAGYLAAYWLVMAADCGCGAR